MKFLISVFIGIALITSGCNTAKKEKNKQTVIEKPIVKKQQKKKKKKPSRKIPLLNDKNVVKVLKAYGDKHDESIVLIQTTMGDIKVQLYNETPLHKANFLMLVNQGFYDKTVFYRVEKDFIIQGGDSDAYERKTIKRRVGYYSIPAEMKPNKLFHKPGALSMARDYENNPDMRSSSFDFFIVQGTKYSKYDLDQTEKDNHITFTPEQRELYQTIGGAAHLDNMHTVFGEVISGMDVVNKIAEVEVDKKAWPRKDVSMMLKVLSDNR